MRNIRVELNHADYWVNWCAAHEVTLEDLHDQRVAPELHALSHWCWQTSSSDSLAVAMAATNYAIEGRPANGRPWSAPAVYAEAFPEETRKKAMKWLKMHAQYDDAHPWEALEIICTLVGSKPSVQLQAELRQAVTKSYDYMYLFLERCMQMDRVKPRGRVAALEA